MKFGFVRGWRLVHRAERSNISVSRDPRPGVDKNLTRILVLPLHLTFRYTIDDGIRDWTEAEAQVSALTQGKRKGVGTVVSVKNPTPVQLKRKADQDPAADVSGGDKKKNRRGMGKNKG